MLEKKGRRAAAGAGRRWLHPGKARRLLRCVSGEKMAAPFARGVPGPGAGTGPRQRNPAEGLKVRDFVGS